MTKFSPKTLDFLTENRLRDSRDWFKEHKPEFEEHVLEPMRCLVSVLAPTVLEIDGALITEPKVDKTISRVYRDTRFSKDKSLYREQMWIVFMRDHKLYEGPPAFFFEISPEGFRYGCGHYQAATADMQALRELALEGNKAFLAAKKALDSQDVFELQGDVYKRPKYPDAPAELRPWLDRKNLFFCHDSTDAGLLFSDRLSGTIAEGFKSLAPAYELLIAARARVKK